MKYWLGIIFFKIFGWTLIDRRPPLDKFVIITAPHTSNWDFFLGLATSFALRLKLRWLGKHTIFVGPLGTLLKHLGGIPIDRRAPRNMVEQITDHFAKEKEFIIALAPEGTRKRKNRWKSGFYHIALQAKVPLVFGFFDFSKKECGLDSSLELTGNPQLDMDRIRHFYRNKHGKYPQNQGPIRIEEENISTEIGQTPP